MTFGPGKHSRRPVKPRQVDKDLDVSEVVKQIQTKLPHREEYRDRALALFGLICARCGREYEEFQRHLITVHHRDGNHLNNPPDGSNWENLCVYCHEDTHSRDLLGNYLGGDKY